MQNLAQPSLPVLPFQGKRILYALIPLVIAVAGVLVMKFSLGSKECAPFGCYAVFPWLLSTISLTIFSAALVAGRITKRSLLQIMYVLGMIVVHIILLRFI